MPHFIRNRQRKSSTIKGVGVCPPRLLTGSWFKLPPQAFIATLAEPKHPDVNFHDNLPFGAYIHADIRVKLLDRGAQQLGLLAARTLSSKDLRSFGLRRLLNAFGLSWHHGGKGTIITCGARP